MALKDLIFERFWSENGIDYGHFGLRVFFHSSLIDCFVYRVIAFGGYCWFSHGVTNIQTTKLFILLIFYFHDV